MLRDWVLDQDAVHVDETGWRTAGDPRALWTAATEGASIFEIAEHCNREQFNELIGDYDGIIISDRWNGYEHLDADRRQVCWSHIQRDFRRHSEDSERFAERALSAAATCRQQHRSLFAYLTELLTARTRGDPLPALA